MKYALVLLLAVTACAPIVPTYRDTSVPITSKALFEPARFAGTWYEIASYPTPFQQGCTRTTATYQPKPDGTLSVYNRCIADGRVKDITGSAKITGPGRLNVQLDGVPFVRSPYWVLWVDEDYQTAVTGSPNGTSAWILNRTPTLRADRLQAAKDILKFNGYDLSQLRMTPQ